MISALAFAAAAVATLWTWLAWRLLVAGRPYAPIGPDPGPTLPDAPRVDAIVPAHNEEAHVAGTIRDLLAQEYPSLTITVVDDQSVDGTLNAIERACDGLPEADRGRLRVVRGVERPAGWVGKTWAVRQGVAETSAPWLLFVDADMGLHPRALATAWKLAANERADLVSLLPRTGCETFWQGTMASAVWFVLSQVMALHRVNDPARPDALAAGGFILVNRVAYDRAGGHEAVRHEIVEDVKLARIVKASGGRLAVRPAGRVAWTHMYGSFADIWRGLRKNCYAGMDYQIHKFVTGAIGALVISWTPAVALAAGLATTRPWLAALGGWGVVAQFVTGLPVAAFLGLPPAYAFTLPLGLSTYVAIGISGVWHHHQGRVIWKDRTIDARVVDTARGGPAAVPAPEPGAGVGAEP